MKRLVLAFLILILSVQSGLPQQASLFEDNNTSAIVLLNDINNNVRSLEETLKFHCHIYWAITGCLVFLNVMIAIAAASTK